MRTGELLVYYWLLLLLGFDEDFMCEAHAYVREMVNSLDLPTPLDCEQAAAEVTAKRSHPEMSVQKFLQLCLWQSIVKSF